MYLDLRIKDVGTYEYIDFSRLYLPIYKHVRLDLGTDIKLFSNREKLVGVCELDLNYCTNKIALQTEKRNWQIPVKFAVLSNA